MLSKKNLLFTICLLLLVFAGVFGIYVFYFNVLVNQKNIFLQLIFSLFAIIIMLIMFVYLKKHRISKNELLINFKCINKQLLFSIIISITICLLLVLKFFLIEKGTIISKSFTKYLFNFTYILVFVAIYEEILFRGLVQNVLNKVMNPVLSVLLTALIFSLMHLFSLGITIDGGFFDIFVLKFNDFITLFVLHIILYIITRKYNSIIPAIIFHFTWDFILFILYK